MFVKFTAHNATSFPTAVDSPLTVRFTSLPPGVTLSSVYPAAESGKGGWTCSGTSCSTAVLAVIDSVLGLVKLNSTVKNLPIIGAHWGLGISILMVWWIDTWPAAGWGLVMKEDWMNIVANGAIVYAAIPLRDAIMSMVNKGLRA